jgi:hypothetical protein
MWGHGYGFWLGTIAALILLGNLMFFGVVLVRYLLQRHDYVLRGDDAEQAAASVVDGTGRRTR